MTGHIPDKAGQPACEGNAGTAQVYPARVMPLCERVWPLELSLGTRPRKDISCFGGAKRRESPDSATMIVAERKVIPRDPMSASTTGRKRHSLTAVCKVAQIRSRLSFASVTALRYSVKAMFWAGYPKLI